MSNATVDALSSNGAQKVSSINEIVIRIAGNSQDGIQAIGGFLARLAGRSEQEVMTFMTIPSTISGGSSIFQVRIGSGEVLSSGDEPDVLLAVRTRIADDPAAFRKTFDTPKIKKIVGKPRGESAVRPPKGFAADHPAIDLIKRKQHVFFEHLDPALATTPKLFTEVVKRFEAMTPLVKFLDETLLGKRV